VNFVAYDLPTSEFPFTIEYVNHGTGEVIHTETVRGPGVLRVMSLEELGGEPVGVRLTGPDGHESYAPPPKETL